MPSEPEVTKRIDRVDGKPVQFSRLDKIMFPETGMTKGDVIDYYTTVAEVILPQLRNRLVTRIRFPDGVGGERFFEKNTPRSAPHWLRRFLIDASPGSPTSKKQVCYPVVDDLAGLLWMANQAALELHTPQWTIGPRGGLRKPDRLVIDLDPGEGIGLNECAEVAHLAADRLAEDGLRAIPVTSGGKGIHLYAPVDGRRNAMRIHAYVQKFAHELAAAYPDLIVSGVRKEGRVGKVFIDWSQNHPARSTGTPYTLRGKQSPTVAAPRFWDEITDGLTQLSPEEVLRRLNEHGDILGAERGDA